MSTDNSLTDVLGKLNHVPKDTPEVTTPPQRSPTHNKQETTPTSVSPPPEGKKSPAKAASPTSETSWAQMYTPLHSKFGNPAKKFSIVRVYLAEQV